MAQLLWEKSKNMYVLCYKEPTEEEKHSVYSQLKIFIPALWDNTKVLGTQE